MSFTSPHSRLYKLNLIIEIFIISKSWTLVTCPSNLNINFTVNTLMNIESITFKLRSCCFNFISSYFRWNIYFKLIKWHIRFFINWLKLFNNIRNYGFINIIINRIRFNNELPLNLIYCCCLVICYLYSLDHVILLLFFFQPLLNFLLSRYFWLIFHLSIFCCLLLNFNLIDVFLDLFLLLNFNLIDVLLDFIY